MKFSVIIPAYNAAATLGAALDSLVAQQWPAYEVIVVDDGSTDETAAVAKFYEEKLPLRLLQTENRGLGAARNLGMDQSTGQAWAFLDADDSWAWNRLSLTAHFMAKYPDQPWFYGPVFEWSEGVLRPRACPTIRHKRDFLQYNPVVPSAMIVRAGSPFRWEEDREQVEDLGPELAWMHQGILPVKIPHRMVKYRVAQGVTADVEAHFKKVFAALDHARSKGWVSDQEAKLYRVRKAYEAVRTYQKSGEPQKAKAWAETLAGDAKGVDLPAGLRWRIRFFL